MDVHVQHDWHVGTAPFWVSTRAATAAGKDSVFVARSAKAGDSMAAPELPSDAEDLVRVTAAGGRRMRVWAAQADGMPPAEVDVVAPSATRAAFSTDSDDNPRVPPVLAAAVSSRGDVVVGGADGRMSVLLADVADADAAAAGRAGAGAGAGGAGGGATAVSALLRRVPCVGHVLDVQCVAWFPSDAVVLSGSSDMTVRVWAADDGRCAAQLMGHVGGVLDVAIVARGRNVVSCSRDTTCKLWDVSTATALATFPLSSPVQCCCLLPEGSASAAVAAAGRTGDLPLPPDAEVGTDGRVVVAGTAGGVSHVVDVRGRRVAAELESRAPDGSAASVHACAAMPSGHEVVTGDTAGRVLLWDLRDAAAPVAQTQPPRVCGVEALSVVAPSAAGGGVGVWPTWADGTVAGLQATAGGLHVTTLATGAFADPVTTVCAGGGGGAWHGVVTGCRDGQLRWYAV